MPAPNPIGKDAVVTHHEDLPLSLPEPVAELRILPAGLPEGA